MIVSKVTFDRTSLTLPDLVADTPGVLWLPEEGVEWPRFPRRKTRAPAVPYLDGDGALLTRTRGLGTFPLTIYAGAATTAALATLKAEVQAAVDQWSYALTLTVDAVDHEFSAECVDDEIAWGEIDSGMVRAHIARGTVAIPLLP